MSPETNNRPTSAGIIFIIVVLGLIITSQSSHSEEITRTQKDKGDIEEVIVKGERVADPTEPTHLTKALLKVPGTFGDPFAAILSLPGVVEESEGDGQPAVRGTGPEDNNFLIDYLPASYVFHDLGLSIFNEHLIRDFGLHAAGFGPEYDSAIGAVFDVALREPRQQPIKTTVDLSFLRTGVLVEGRVTQNSALYISGRQSLYHLLLEAFEDDIEEDEDISISRQPKWHDYQAKYTWTPSDNSSLSFLALGSNDRASVSLGSQSEDALLDPGSIGRADLDTKFSSQSLVWNYAHDISSARLGFGRLTEDNEQKLGDGRDRLALATEAWTAKGEYSRKVSEHSKLRVGAELRRQNFDYDLDLRYQSCTRFSADCDDPVSERLVLADSQRVDTYAGFLEYEWQPSKQITFAPAIRYTHNKYLNETSVEPRVRLRYSASDRLALNASVGKYHQMPFIDEFAPVAGNPDIRSPEATHYVIGLNLQASDYWNASLSVYHKTLNDLIVDVSDSRNYTNAGKGEAYGAELMLQRALSNSWSGWASVSWARSKRTNTLADSTFTADHDTPIVANLVANYAVNKWNFSARFTARSGAPYTPITGNQPNPDFANSFLPVYGELNSKRAKAFHRLDLRAERSFGWGRVNGSYYLDVLNAYGASNGGAVYYEPIANSSEFELKEEDGLPLLPSIGLTLSF